MRSAPFPRARSEASGTTDLTSWLYDRLIKSGDHISTGRCYDLMHQVWTASMPESPNLTEGLYGDDEGRGYEEAQRAKRRLLLDAAGVRAGSRVLDVGCGHGTLLEDVAARGALGVGITLSPEQAAYCARRGLNATVRNWKDLGHAWDGQFDAVIASGSLEHFVAPRDHKNQARVYGAFFRACRELLDARGAAPRLVVTTCVFHRRFTAEDGPWKEHLLNLGYFMDGCYPRSPDTVVAASEPHFRLVERHDATRDYLLTSRVWQEQIVETWTASKALTFARVVLQNAHHPLDVLMTLKFFRDRSWLWQFEGRDPPVRLYRFVFEAVG